MWVTNILVDGYTADAVGDDSSTGGIFHTLDESTDVGLYGGIFKGAVAGCVEGAVLKYQVVRIAEGLLATNVAAYQTKILGVPP